MTIGFRLLKSVAFRRDLLELRIHWTSGPDDIERFNTWPELAARYDELLAIEAACNETQAMASPRTEGAELPADPVCESVVAGGRQFLFGVPQDGN